MAEFAQTIDNSDELRRAVGSILVADCGNSFTRVSLLERVGASYCFLAHTYVPTTVEPPWSDVSLGVRHAIERLKRVTGRTFLDSNGTLIVPKSGVKGVDLFVLTASAAQPLQVVLAGLVSQVSLASLQRAASSAYAQVVGVISRDYVGPPLRSLPHDQPAPGADPQDGAGLADEDKIALIRQHNPDVVWIAGGTDGGSHEPVRDLVETLALACTLVDTPQRPTIVYAGNTELRSGIADIAGQEVKLEVVDNVRPELNVENLSTARAAFQSAYVLRKLQRLPGIRNLLQWSQAPVLPTAQALGYLVMYLERLYESGKGVLCADVGSATTSVAASFPRTAEEGSQPSLQVAADLGVGYGAPALLERVGVDAISRWLPFEPEPDEVQATLLNKGVRPMTLPYDRRQLLIEQAVARESLRIVMGRAREIWHPDVGRAQYRLTPHLDPIIASGSVLGRAPRPGQTVLMLLDAIEPVGISTIVLDEHGLASALGAMAVIQPLAAVQALDAGAFITLGTVVAPVGRARPGDVIMRVKITFEQGGELELEAKYGSLEVLPLRLGEKATLELKPRRGISVGRVGKAVEVNGGIIGLVIDARGRPLNLPADPEDCRDKVQQWLWDMGA
jgi:hypothetical protein